MCFKWHAICFRKVFSLASKALHSLTLAYPSGLNLPSAARWIHLWVLHALGVSLLPFAPTAPSIWSASPRALNVCKHLVTTFNRRSPLWKLHTFSKLPLPVEEFHDYFIFYFLFLFYLFVFIFFSQTVNFWRQGQQLTYLWTLRAWVIKYKIGMLFRNLQREDKAFFKGINV